MAMTTSSGAKEFAITWQGEQLCRFRHLCKLRFVKKAAHDSRSAWYTFETGSSITGIKSSVIVRAALRLVVSMAVT